MTAKPAQLATLQSGSSFSDMLSASARRHLSGVDGIDNLCRLTGGASQESWAFSTVGANGSLRLVLRRAPPGAVRSPLAVGLTMEAELIRRAGEANVPVPRVAWVLDHDEGLGEGFVMGHVQGETIARRILRDAHFAQARAGIVEQCGRILATIHRMPVEGLSMRRVTAAEQIDAIVALYRETGQHRPVFHLALRHLRSRLPAPTREATLVHADFRLGNLMVGEDGIRAVLDWEIAHIGDPIADLGWMCVNSWRFGQVDRPAMGIGTREALLDAYLQAGGSPATRDDLLFWEMLGTLYWGVICADSAARFTRREDTSVERALIARRVSETEADLLFLMREEWP